ncbi:MAG: hypothetical protein M3041_10835 [Acidobacteriota bacterium]|nr:hypothetical protein [Acidobacteriota bacterium]
MLKARIAVILFFAAAPIFAQDDLSRLSAILLDAQNSKVTISASAWKVTVNEANVLANRIAKNSGGKKAARDLQMHVREMRKAALGGDASGAQSHASEAMPFVYQLMR